MKAVGHKTTIAYRSIVLACCDKDLESFRGRQDGLITDMLQQLCTYTADRGYIGTELARDKECRGGCETGRVCLS